MRKRMEVDAGARRRTELDADVKQVNDRRSHWR